MFITKAKSLYGMIRGDKRFDIVLIFLLCLFVVIVGYVWRSIELRPPHWDMGRHLYNSVIYLNHFKAGELSQLAADYRYYPPFIYWIAIPYYLAFGLSVKTAILSNSFLILVLGFSVYGLGSRLWGRRVGLLSAVLILCSPMLVTQFKEFQLDAPATAMVALSMYLIVRTEEFKNRDWSLALGIVLGLTMLTKWTLGFILILPISYAVLRGLMDAWKTKNLQPIFNMLIAFLSAYFIASFWYLQNFGQIRYDLITNGSTAGANEGDPVVGTYASNVWYSLNLANSQLYLVPFALFLTGLVFMFKNLRKYFTRNIYPILLIIGTLFFFTMLRNKDARYTLPMLVGVVIIATYWVGLIARGLYGNIISLLIVAYCIITFWIISFGSALLPQQIKWGEVNIFAQRGYIIGPPTKEDWRQSDIFLKISQQPGAKKLYTVYSPEEMYFNSWGNKYFSEIKGITIVDDLEKANYIITSKNNELNQDKKFTIISEYSLPNGTTIYLLKRVE